MTEYVQRISRAEECKDAVIKVAFRADLISRFYDEVGKGMKSIGCHYFTHNLVKNYCKEGHTTSSFYTNLDWQEKYWKDYWDCDPLWYASHPIAQVNGVAIMSWRVINLEDDCMEDRKTMCKMRDGLSFYIQHDNGVLENFSFGWEKYDISRINRKKLATLCNMVTDFRIQHFKLNQEMFETFPAVQFH